ncbi:MAG: hypothetical protein ACMUFK_00520 [Thermoplasmatota archaeon]
MRSAGFFKRTLASLLILAALLAASFVTTVLPGDGIDQLDLPSTRAEVEDLKLENTTHTVSYPFNEEWGNVYIGYNSTLVIEGSNFIAKRVICRAETEKTALRILDFEGIHGLLSVSEGIVNVKADIIEVVGSTISVVNGTATLPNGENGGNAEISLLSKDSDLTITDSELNVKGHNGGQGVTEYGGKGGKAYLFLGSLNSHKVALTGSNFIVEGGAGGNAFVNDQGSGEGAEATLKISSEAVDIKSSTFYVKGGNAGAHSLGSQGNVGGNSYMNIESAQDLYLSSIDLEAKVGINTNNEVPKKSFIVLKSISRKVLWDHEKTGDDMLATLSHVSSDTLNIDTKTGGELHQVDTGIEPPQPLGTGALKLYWWAKLTVKDKYNEPIKGAKITYTIDPDPLPYPRGESPEIITNDNGMVNIEIIGREDQNWNKLTFQAEDYGGALGLSDQYRFDENTNRDVPIEIVRMTIDLVEPDLKKDVGGSEVDFRGTAVPGNPKNIVQNVTLYVDLEVIGYGRDISEEGAPPFSLWILDNWDSTTVPDGPHELLIVAIDSAYQVRSRQPMNVNQQSVNHRPTLDMVTMIDRTGSYEVEKGGKVDIHVNQDESIIKFNVEVYEIDMLSTILKTGEGKKVVKATVDFIHIPTSTVILNDKVIGEDDIEKINLTGGYGFSFEIDANKRPGKDEPYAEGEYRVAFIIEDDGGLTSREESVFFTLYFDFYPRIVMYIEPNLRPSTDPEFTEESFIVETKKSDTYTARFNLTDSSDRDDPLWSSDPTQDRSWINLRYHIEIMDPEGNRETVFGPDQKGAGFVHDFDVSDVPKGKQGIFTIFITCKDQEGLESTLRLKIRVTHNPPPVDKGILGQELPYGIPGDIMSIVSPALFIVMAMVFLLLLLLIQKRNNDDKKKKMELLDKKKKEEDKAKGSSAIEDEFTAGRTQDSRAYLKSSGGEKGREEFAKELQAAQKKGPEGGQVPDKEHPEQKPAPVSPQKAPIAPEQKPVAPASAPTGIPNPPPPLASQKPPHPAPEIKP